MLPKADKEIGTYGIYVCVYVHIHLTSKCKFISYSSLFIENQSRKKHIAVLAISNIIEISGLRVQIHKNAVIAFGKLRAQGGMP